MDFSVDKEIKRLKRERFRLEKEREAIKKDILFKNGEKRKLEKANDRTSKIKLIKILKELYVLNKNCNLKTEAIRAKTFKINELEVRKTKDHQSIKRVRTRERHCAENMALVGDCE